jgi:hypothetical protein
METDGETITFRKIGGVASLVGAATNLFALVTFVTFLASKDFGSDDPSKVVAFLSQHEAFMRAWYQVIYLVFGLCLGFLSLAISERLKTGSSPLTQAVTSLGLIWAVLVLLVGTLSISNLSTVVKLYGENPAQAATVWKSAESVEADLGGGGGETVVSALWFLLVSRVALRTNGLPRRMNHLGLVTGGAGILSVLFLTSLTAVYGLGLILWFIWLGVILLRSGGASNA